VFLTTARILSISARARTPRWASEVSSLQGNTCGAEYWRGLGRRGVRACNATHPSLLQPLFLRGAASARRRLADLSPPHPPLTHRRPPTRRPAGRTGQATPVRVAAAACMLVRRVFRGEGRWGRKRLSGLESTAGQSVSQPGPSALQSPFFHHHHHHRGLTYKETLTPPRAVARG
jgi:hypothetical protein